MRKVTSYKCPECEMKFKSLAGWGNHMHRVHSDTIPKGYSDARYFYYCQTGKSSGKCVQCKKPTSWNEETGKYNRYCDNPKCKQDYCKMAKKRMVDKYGKVHLLNDPEKQREMLANRKISGKYTFQDGGSLGYVGSYEKDFLMMCDHTLGLKSSDIMSPSPHNYIYIYEGKEHFYIPDFYIPNLNLELEIKDGSTNPNMMPKIQQIDKVKEKIKDEIMIANPSVNYFKVVNKEYDHFFEFLNNCKNAIDDDFLTQIQTRIATEGAMDDDIEGYEVANEGAIINQPDQYFNIDNWHKGKNTNILYITGLSGSGKSTTGKSIANTHNAVYIELDRTMWGKYVEADWNPEMPKNRDIANSFFREIYSDPELKFDPSMKDKRAKREIIRKINYRLWDLCKSMPEVLFVWEGITIYESFDFNFLQNKPVVIKGTAITTSMTRKNKRDANYHMSMKDRMEHIDWYREGENHLNALRNKMSKNAISSPSLESAQSHEAPLSSFKFRETDVKIGKTPAKLYEWYDGDNLVGSFRMFDWWDGKNIEDLKVSDAYKGKGYSYQLLDYATKKAGCKNLAVKKSNNIAKHVYDRYGFKVTQEDNDMYYMSLDSVMTQWSPVVPYNGEFDANAIDPATEAVIFGFGKKGSENPDSEFKLSWKDKLFKSNIVGNAVANTYTKVTVNNGIITIKGINCNLLVSRMRSLYKQKKLLFIFNYIYNARSFRLFEEKKINRSYIKIDYITVHQFFTIELIEMFNQLGEHYDDKSYTAIAKALYESSWLKVSDNKTIRDTNTANLKNLRIELLPHQINFIKSWERLKARLHLKGYVLSFNAGKGKTLTAIGLAECIEPTKVYIVCPNNLKENWAREIQKYYSKYDDEATWKNDIAILGSSFGNVNTAKYIITNNENIKAMVSIAEHDPNAMVIVDECHNFRNYDGQRSMELYTLCDKISPSNVLCMSATPIKASPSEISPVLRIIDPVFNDEVAKIFAKCFAVENTVAAELIQKRFGMVIYRPVDTNTDLPIMTQTEMRLSTPNESKYYLSTVHDEIIEKYKKLHSEWLTANDSRITEFADDIHKYSTANSSLTRGYIKWVMECSNSVLPNPNAHELTIKEYQEFIATYIATNPNVSTQTASVLTTTQNEFIVAAKSHMGTAIGAILPKRRAELFEKMYLANASEIHKLIAHNTKKTVIFSPMVDVVDTIYKELCSSGIGAVRVTGNTNDRLSAIEEFHNNPKVIVMVATTGTLGEGFTFNEASQLFFFGTPWRSADYDQASKRIHRIGQDSPVTVTNVLLKSDKPNLSDRMQSILVWSRNMFDTSISSIEFTEAFEAAIGTDPNIIQKYDNKKYYPLFIILLCNKSLLGDTIRTVTKEPYSHSSISFDASMNDIYTFGNKIIKKGEYTKRSFGSARESFKHDSFKFSYPSEAKYGLYCIFFNEKQIKAMKAKVENIFENHEQYHYNIEGLIKYVFGKASTDPYKMFCSQFVSTIISTGKKDILDRDPSLYSPWGLTSLEGIQHIEDGNIATYDQKRIEKKTKEIFKMIVRSGDTAILESAFNFNEILSYGNDIALPDASLEMSLEAAIASDDSKLKFETPQELIKWMKSNIAYKEFDHLMTAEEVFVERRGSCHDQANFIVRQLNRMGIRASKLFFIAYNDHSTVGGMTHTLVYYTEGKNVIWVENSWVGNQGVRTYRNESDMRMDVFKRYQRTSDFSMYPELEFRTVKGVTPGMTLPQYVDAIMK